MEQSAENTTNTNTENNISSNQEQNITSTQNSKKAVEKTVFDTKIEFLKGVGGLRAEVLQKELNIRTFGDLLMHLPFRYEDRTQFQKIGFISEEDTAVQLKGRLRNINLWGEGKKKRLEAVLEDSSGEVKLVWFRGAGWVAKKLKDGQEYIVYGRPNMYGRNFSIAHPEIDLHIPLEKEKSYFQPVYHTSEKMKAKGMDSRGISNLMQTLIRQVHKEIEETLPPSIIEKQDLLDRRRAIVHIHFPKNTEWLEMARKRLKFEELFFIQLQLLQLKLVRTDKNQGLIFEKTPTLTKFYKEHLPFELTGAQKRVIKEIHQDVQSGSQMNRLLQGDVGSGKTIVSFLIMLMGIDYEAQSCLMAPTEILAQQHYEGLKGFCDLLGLRIDILTGSTRTKARREMLADLKDGKINIIVGTHALLEDRVQFQKLGICVIDEQHRFGVAQRAKLWQKNEGFFPHVLVMTATPIPRTLAMTLYGDLDVSIIDELPAGRKPIKTVHKFDAHRLRVFGFMQSQIDLGRQIYLVYPLIEESETLDYKNLEDGYESICRAFPNVPVSILHGKMKPNDKDFEMQRFAKGETKILVATTVIEVGVNVPNASVMIIENSERFGLSQLHQLRGRVGRGSEQSYCILMSGYKLSKEGKKRLEVMVRTVNGFEIADEDLKLRGAGDIAGTQQSGAVDLRIADLARDGEILKVARDVAQELLKEDPKLEKEENLPLVITLEKIQKAQTINWSRIS
ncbi:ATP-dependent DNA helicase RecG [Bernardetia sp. Wsw4-3y2]|uniref:ATP-dependent DNA helicase RecG n=1 Tax=Bernardetia sp. Wsw4-3y2 TaxID=3127471 RepID=UPI0030D482D5